MSLHSYFKPKSHINNNEKRKTETAFNILDGKQRQIVTSSLGLIGRQGVRSLGLTGTNFVAAASEVWCFCDMPEKDYNEDHPMVFCQGSTCKRKWFHFSCIGKATNWSAEGDYYCPSCSRGKN